MEYYSVIYSVSEIIRLENAHVFIKWLKQVIKLYYRIIIMYTYNTQRKETNNKLSTDFFSE